MFLIEIGGQRGEGAPRFIFVLKLTRDKLTHQTLINFRTLSDERKSFSLEENSKRLSLTAFVKFQFAPKEKFPRQIKIHLAKKGFAIEKFLSSLFL